MIKKTVLDNGVRIITKTVKDRNSTALGFWIATGGRFEPDAQKGAAHFLEHIVFKGSDKYNCDEIKTRIEGIGGALNAFTAEEQTCFYAKIPSKHINQTFDVLSDMVLKPKIRPYDVKKEKSVIIEEIKMYQDLPQYRVLESVDGLMWPNHPLGKSLAGSEETVSNMTAADLRGFHAKHYVPDNIVVSACGKVDHQKIVRLVKAKFGSLKKKSVSDCVPFEEKQTKPRIEYLHKDIEQMHLGLGIPAYHESHKDKYVLSILSILLGGNMSSRLFVEVREKKGLAYSISCSYKTLCDTGLFLIRAGVDNLKVVEAITVIHRELEKIKRKGVGKDEFLRAKEYLSGQLLLGLEDTMDHMLWIGEGIVAQNHIKTLAGVLKQLNAVKPADIQRVAKDLLSKKHYNLALVGPITKEQKSSINTILGLK